MYHNTQYYYYAELLLIHYYYIILMIIYSSICFVYIGLIKKIGFIIHYLSLTYVNWSGSITD